MEQPASQRRLLATIFLTVFIDLLGVGLIIPIIAPLFTDSHVVLGPEVSAQTRKQLYGLLVAMFPLCQFFSAPMLGSLSDRYGRKPVLFWSLFTTFASFLMFAFGIQTGMLWMLFVSRGLQGAAAGNLSVIYSAIADSSDSASRTRNFGLVGVAFGMGFIIGPAIGGYLSDSTHISWFDKSTPFFASAGLVLVNILLVRFQFPETLRTPNPSVQLRLDTGIRNLGKAFSNPALQRVFATIFFFSFGFTMFTQFFQIYLIERFNFKEVDIGQLFAFIGLVGALTQGLLVRALSKRFSPRQILPVSLLTLASGYLAALLPQAGWQMYLTVPLVAISQGLTMPNFSSLISSSAPPHMQGETLGIQQSVMSVGQFLPLILGGFAVAQLLSAPMLLGAASTVIAWGMFMWNESVRRRADAAA